MALRSDATIAEHAASDASCDKSHADSPWARHCGLALAQACRSMCGECAVQRALLNSTEAPTGSPPWQRAAAFEALGMLCRPSEANLHMLLARECGPLRSTRHLLCMHISYIGGPHLAVYPL